MGEPIHILEDQRTEEEARGLEVDAVFSPPGFFNLQAPVYSAFDLARLRAPAQPPSLAQRVHGHAQRDVCRLTRFHRRVRLLAAANAFQVIVDMARRRGAEPVRLRVFSTARSLPGGGVIPEPRIAF